MSFPLPSCPHGPHGPPGVTVVIPMLQMSTPSSYSQPLMSSGAMNLRSTLARQRRVVWAMLVLQRLATRLVDTSPLRIPKAYSGKKGGQIQISAYKVHMLNLLKRFYTSYSKCAFGASRSPNIDFAIRSHREYTLSPQAVRRYAAVPLTESMVS